MGWRRRRDGWRTLPRGKRRAGRAVHWGPYQKIPGVPPGSDVDLSTSGRVQMSRPWYRSAWILFLPVGALACYAVFPALLLGLGWIVGSGALLWLIYRQWRPH